MKRAVKAATKTTIRPVRFDPVDDRFLSQASFDTGLSISDIMRRAVKLLKRQKQMLKSYSFILDLK